MKRIFGSLKDFFSTNLGSQVSNYLFFYAIVWAFHLLLVSVIAFFHLILGHNIGTIADWIVDRGWIQISITKILIFMLAIQFMRLRNKKYAHIRGMLRNSFAIPRHESFVVIIFLLFSLIGAGDIYFNQAYIFEPTRILFSTLGTLIFFGIDLVLILILDVFHPLKHKRDTLRKITIFSLLFYLVTRATFIYEQTISFKLFSYFFLILYCAYWRRRNWSLPLLVVSTILVPAFALFGLDPVWGETFSPFQMRHDIGTVSITIMFAIAILYFEYRKKKNPEYIYRD
jgi:hypothetical protein